ncbi:uncharacterized protein BDZ99DRAFT_503654 [Mytilinidion resinicola]|uniref:Fungal-type protein kinase domain-containing protein n=1 Tax=Mytilinidion resinicola TaxID=574789 RepID=A0A6A6Y4N9_9PEZI|nr:uncharacterized protein BDZ99DRAFT_503654 [Mytilinidion resinicola]KAF2802994.1 hypothetical protein BDZ99DRAFT_503654 [Mytilinidion resinicola]
MATASELDKMRCNPIKERLGAFRRLFETTRSDLGVALSSGAVQTVFATAATLVVKNLVLDLIQALQMEPAARTLPSRIADGTVYGDLALLYGCVHSNQLDIALAIPLVELIVRNEPGTPTSNDADIWRTVFELIARTHPPTPPTAFEKAVFDTPLRSSSASQRGIEQTHDEVDQRILEKLTGRVYFDVGGFYERYFEGKCWANTARDIYEESRAQCTEGRWTGWPEPSLQGPFFEWFMKFQDSVSGLRRKYYTSANKALSGSEADRKLDIFLTPADATLPDGEHDWSNVLVIGEHKQNPDEDRSIKTLVQLAGSGPYNSEKFDIHMEPERFIRVIAGYALMTEAELGLNTFIKRDGNSKYIVVRGVRISQEDHPIASQKAIVCRGTTCYRRRRGDSGAWEHVVKFAWPSDKRQREGDLLKLAKERGVKGIAEWFHHEQITIDENPDTIAHFRRGMKFGAPRKLSSKASWVDGSVESSRAYPRTRSLRRSRSSAARLTGLGVRTSSTTISSSGKKRKRDGEFVDGNSRKRSRLIEPDTTGHHSIQEAQPDSLAGREKAAAKGDLKGMLIDLDLAKELDSVPSGASHRIGTMQFMAIEVLQGKGHTYRHDLETFFYVFTWMCIRYGHDYMDNGQASKKGLLATSRLRRWYTGTYADISDTKLGHMDKNGFENVIAEFAPKFEGLKQLARELRNVLFPIRDGAIFTGTFRDNNIMYDGMIKAFDRAIGSLGKEVQATA